MILISVYTLLEYGHQYLMKNFFESEFFQSEYQNFTDQLGPLVLNPLDADEAKSNIKVSDKEIEEYRNYNGTLSEQITNINEQYQDKIDEAKDSKVTSVKNALIKDRDKKIQDITKNFEDDDYDDFDDETSEFYYETFELFPEIRKDHLVLPIGKQYIGCAFDILLEDKYLFTATVGKRGYVKLHKSLDLTDEIMEGLDNGLRVIARVRD